MRRPSPLPEGIDPTAFGVAEAQRLGVSRGRTRSASLTTPYHGVRTAGPVTSTLERAIAYARWMAPTQFFSHLTAAELSGLRLPDGFRAGHLHVSSAPPARAPRSRGVIGHQTSPLFALGAAFNLPVSSAVDTWLMLGSSLSVDDLTVMGDGLVSRRRPTTDVNGLAEALARAVGRRGLGRLTAALQQIRPNTDSARETLLRLTVMRAGLPEPEVNGAITNSFGAVVAHGDLVYRDYRTILEYDGGHHREDERQFNIDVDRLDQLMEEEWRVIRVNKNLLLRGATLIGKVETALVRGGWTPSPKVT